MASLWISASKVIQVFGKYKPEYELKMAICARAHQGLIKAQAKTLSFSGEARSAVELPRQFWWAEGHEALEQDWDTGDFSTFMNDIEMRAFSVSFDLDGLLGLIAFESRHEVLGMFAAGPNPDWISALGARRYVYEQGGIEPNSAAKALLEQCALGFVSARASLCQISNTLREGQWAFEEREWNIEPWVWQTLKRSDTAPFDWQSGTFTGKVRDAGVIRLIKLTAVYFLKSSLSIFSPSLVSKASVDESEQQTLSPLSESQLNKWWNEKVAVRDSLTQEELLTLVRAAFPQNGITRDRIRALTGPRTTGRKPIRDKTTAK